MEATGDADARSPTSSHTLRARAEATIIDDHMARSRIASPHLDDVDRAIVEALQSDGRLPYTRLGQTVGLSEAAVRQRVQRLLDAGVMQVVAVTNPLSVGYKRMALIGLRCDGDTSRVAAELEGWDEIEYLVITAGSFDVMCEVVVADDANLLELTNRLRRFAGVRSTETFIYLDLLKQTYAWGAH